MTEGSNQPIGTLQEQPKAPEKKYHKLSSLQKKLLVVAFVLFFFVLGPLLGFYYYKFAVSRPSQIIDEIAYEIQSGAAVADISKDLYDLGVINSQNLFNFYVYWNKIDKDIQAGVYTIPAGISVVNLADLLQHGVNDTKVTFLEGWRVEEFAREASNRLHNIDYDEFVRIALQYEGYLFPDTYMLNQDIQETRLLEILRATFKDKTKNSYSDEALSLRGLTKEEALIFASIVEREVDNEVDRPLVAGILIKRWQEDMTVGADATVQYAVAKDKYCVPASCRDANATCVRDPAVDSCLESLSSEQAMEIDWWPSDIYFYDLDFESDYNTRKNIGLTPRPICNPGLGALDAVANYQESDYYFYLNDSDGITHYAPTLAGHEANVALYLR
jgi:UPF0755 protein